MKTLTTFTYKVDENTTHNLTYKLTNDAGYIEAVIKDTDVSIFFPADYIERFIKSGKIVRTEDTLIQIYTMQANEAKEYIKRYENHPFADKLTYNKKKLAFARKCLKELQPKDMKETDNIILFEYVGKQVIKEDKKEKYRVLTFVDGKTLALKYK